MNDHKVRCPKCGNPMKKVLRKELIALGHFSKYYICTCCPLDVSTCAIIDSLKRQPSESEFQEICNASAGIL